MRTTLSHRFDALLFDLVYAPGPFPAIDIFHKIQLRFLSESARSPGAGPQSSPQARPMWFISSRRRSASAARSRPKGWAPEKVRAGPIASRLLPLLQ